jgi:hypothetical protein
VSHRHRRSFFQPFNLRSLSIVTEAEDRDLLSTPFAKLLEST